MLGILDAICIDCGRVIQWDTTVPRLCADCLLTLLDDVQGSELPEETTDTADRRVSCWACRNGLTYVMSNVEAA